MSFLTGFGFGRTFIFFFTKPKPYACTTRATLVDILTPPLIMGRCLRRWTVQCSRLRESENGTCEQKKCCLAVLSVKRRRFKSSYMFNILFPVQSRPRDRTEPPSCPSYCAFTSKNIFFDCYTFHTSLESYDTRACIAVIHFKIKLQQQAQSMSLSSHKYVNKAKANDSTHPKRYATDPNKHGLVTFPNVQTI